MKIKTCYSFNGNCPCYRCEECGTHIPCTQENPNTNDLCEKAKEYCENLMKQKGVQHETN